MQKDKRLSPQTEWCRARRAGRRWTAAGPARSRPVWDAHAPASALHGWTSEMRGLLIRAGQVKYREAGQVLESFQGSVYEVWCGVSELTSLRHYVNVLLEFLSLRWCAARSGQLRVDVIRDGLERRTETGGRGKRVDVISGRNLTERWREVIY